MNEKKKASASTLAERNIEQKESYHKGNYWSSQNLKEMLGVLLLRLVAGHSESPAGNFLWTQEDINKASWVICRKAYEPEKTVANV
ncbi:MAG: hypothetical protein ABSH16_00380 [Sedimentisphaerales bacterium]